MNTGLRHYQKRKNLKKTAAEGKLSRFMDRFIYVIALTGPLVTIPQVLNVWVEKKVEGISVITWSAYVVITLFWVTYGIIHKEKPIIMSNSLAAMMQFSIVMGVLAHG